MSARRWVCRLAACAVLLQCVALGAAPDTVPLAPEAATGRQTKPGWHFASEAVAAANPLAVEAGAAMLRRGGSALDAAIAVQMVLGLVEPQSSGIGGGAFLLLWDGRRVLAFDGRETAPAAAAESLFLQPDGRPMGLRQAIAGGRAVGTPGVVRMLEQAHREHGRLPWSVLFEPAVTLADNGFAVSPRLHELLADSASLRADPAARAFYYQPAVPGSSALVPWPVGHRLRNPALAEILRRIAARGSVALHEGLVAARIVERVRGHPDNPGLLSMTDLRDYRALQREAICTDWLSSVRVCGFPPPSSGHLTMMQILGLLQALPPSAEPALQQGLPGPDWLHRYTEASRLAFADRAQFIADPAFVRAPAGDWGSLLASRYLGQRAGLIGQRSLGEAAAGRPGGEPSAHAPQAEQVEHGTSHVSIVDARGQAVAMTTTIEAGFGSGLLIDGGTGLEGGFLLNNQLTDFSFEPADDLGRKVANRVEAGKRPRSSMSPTLVFDRRDGRLLMSLGAPGGPAIIHFTAKALIASLDWGLNPQQAVDLPNFANFNGPTLLEAGRFPEATLQALRARGQRVFETDLTSGTQVLMREPGGWFGAADPRREGSVAGR